jgi:hypothetical protein
MKLDICHVKITFFSSEVEIKYAKGHYLKVENF